MKDENLQESSYFGVYDIENKPTLLVSRLRNFSKGEESRETWESMLESICIQLDTFDDSELSDFQEQLLRYYFTECYVDGESRMTEEATKLSISLFYYLFQSIKSSCVEDYMDVLTYSSMLLPVHVLIQFYPVMFKVVVDQLRSDSNFSGGELFADCDIFRFMTAFAMEFSASTDVPSQTMNEFGVFWKEALDFYVTQDCESFDLKLFYGFLACRQCFTRYLSFEEHRISLYKSLVRCMEKKPKFTSFLMSSLLLTYMQNCKMTEKSWPMVSLFIRKLCTHVSHLKPCDDVQNLVLQTVSSFLSFVEAPNEQCIEKLKCSLNPIIDSVAAGSNSQQLSQENRNNRVELTTESPLSRNKIENGAHRPGGSDVMKTSGAAEKSVDLLEKLVTKMKATKVRLSLDSDRGRLQKVISDLQSFL